MGFALMGVTFCRLESPPSLLRVRRDCVNTPPASASVALYLVLNQSLWFLLFSADCRNTWTDMATEITKGVEQVSVGKEKIS